jgi:hypothetical protein
MKTATKETAAVQSIVQHFHALMNIFSVFLLFVA